MEKLIYIKKEILKNFLEKISKDYDVYLPIQDKKNGIINFGNINILNENYIMNLKEKTRQSPKFLFFPPYESLFEFEYKKDIKNPELTEIALSKPSNSNIRKKVIFGIKPCDVRGIDCVDLVFSSGNNKDLYYLNKRENTIIISIGCSVVYPDCFCTSVGGSPFNFGNANIGLLDIGSDLIVMKLDESEKTKQFIIDNNDFFEKKDMDNETENKINEIILQSNKICNANWEKINPENVEAKMENTFKEDTLWQEITKKCISCAACTYVCPTCVCFNIADEQKDKNGERYRCWDFCTNYYYTLEASGHNPREKIYQRYRNKINCKYNYFIKRNKELYCVGCGRCIDVCPVGMDIREIVSSIIGF